MAVCLGRPIRVTDGTEKATCAVPTPVQECTGYLPWVTLGVGQTDAWGKMFRYSVSPEFASNAGFNLSTVAAYPKISPDPGCRWCTKFHWPTTSLPLVMSYGANNFGTTVDGTAMANSSTTNTSTSRTTIPSSIRCGWMANCTTFLGRPVATNTGAAGGEFDDRVVWVSRESSLQPYGDCGEASVTISLAPPASSRSTPCL